MTRPRTLIAGIGNIFLGDDAFGVEVVRRLAGRPQPEGVLVKDFGIRGLDLAYTLMEDWEQVILVDASPRGGSPGTLYVIEPESSEAIAQPASIEAHSMDPVRVFQTVRALGGRLPPIRIVGCEPKTFGSDLEPAPGLSPSVDAAVAEAIRLIESLVEETHSQKTSAQA